jgi:nitroimidazol reductase NimA-like FMN-containing flavoprotein (pyridoxamine 5'-phosphate oxidase superfamily)
MFYARVADTLLLHGAAASRMLEHGAAGQPLCVTVTLLDGLVLARSAFRHSVNYRSVMVLGTARDIVDPDAKRAAAAAFVDHMLPERSRQTRMPNDKELAATRMLALPITEGSAKIREGGPIDDPEDRSVSCWAGHVPVALVASAPVSDPMNQSPVPPGLVGYTRSARR